MKPFSAVAALIAAPAALLLTPGRAEAILTYNIFDSGANQVTLQASGSISRSSLTSPGTISASFSGLIDSEYATLVTNTTNGDIILPGYAITGPTSFAPPVVYLNTGIATGTTTFLSNDPAQLFGVDPNYRDGDPIVSSAIFSGVNLADLGFNTPGLIGSWQLDGVTGDAGRIDLVIGASTASVPGPLPLFGAAAAFGWSRTLRRRISASTPSNA